MPRQARQKSNTGIYHVILRGINRQIIFEDEEDKERIIETLERYKSICGYTLYTYCLMGNHIHILLKTEKENLDLVLKRIGGSYVYWYNLKYKRSGHLFQDRFKSEAVESDRYLLGVIRYIHQNPLKAGLCKDISEYEYSSFREYLRGESRLLDIAFVYSIVDKEAFIKLNNEKHDERCLDVESSANRLNDADAQEIIQSVSKCKNATEFQALESVRRDHYIKELRARGLSIRQISRLTGISFGLVRKV